MKGSYLGEFQEIVLLAILSLDGDAYGSSIQETIKKVAKRNITRGALHSALTRLEEKGFVTSQFGEATQVRGGRRKRLFTVTSTGRGALQEADAIRTQFNTQINPTT